LKEPDEDIALKPETCLNCPCAEALIELSENTENENKIYASLFILIVLSAK
jgi:hypothetical protein